MKLQNQNFKNLSEVGGDPLKLPSAAEIYITANGINKTLDQAIDDGDMGSSSASVENVSSINTFDITPLSNATIVRHQASSANMYLLPSAVEGMRFLFIHEGVNPSGATVLTVDASNNKVDFHTGGVDYTATLANGTYHHGPSGVSGTLGTELKSKMEAQDGGTYTVTFNDAEKTYTIARSASTFFFKFDTGANKANTARFLLGFKEEDGSAAASQTGMSLYNEMRIQPASGDALAYGNYLAETPGYLAIRKRGVALSLVAISNSRWSVEEVNSLDHIKNTTIGDNLREVSIIGRNTWISKANMNTIQGSFGATNLNDYGYIVAGKDIGANPPIAVVQQYNDSANTWATKASDLTSRRGSATFSLNSYAYSCYGDSSNSGTDIDTTNRYNDSTNSWLSRAGGASARRFISRFALNGYGYISGGIQTSTVLTTVQRYNDNLNSWSTMATLISERTAQFGDILNGYAYAFSGSDGSNLSSIHTQYNDSANTWIQKAGVLTARQNGTTLFLNEKLYKCQGYDSSSNRTNTCEEYNDSTNSWKTVTGTSLNRAEIKGFVINGFGYSCGGIDGTYQQTVEQYN